MGTTKKIILVCEDVQHEAFLIACMKELGVRSLHHVLSKWTASREEQGGNIASVINRVCQFEFDAWRKVCEYRKTLLVVVADADAEKTIAERTADFPSAGNDDHSVLYVVVVPKRNIETWVRLGLDMRKSNLVDAVVDYKDKTTTASGACKKASRNLIKCLESPNAELIGNPVWNAFAEVMRKLRAGIKAVI